MPEKLKDFRIFARKLDFLTAIAVAIAVLQVTPVGLGKCCLTGQIVGWSNRLSTLLAR